ncbi:MAG: cytochrome C [Elusimicrobia bacterium]|nr:cytochrome C [Elusimicrobiota bacterium]
MTNLNAVQSLPNSQRRLSAALGWAAASLLFASLFLPYWQARLYAPQYRGGLTARMHLHKLTGDVAEIDELNHYIGMRKLGDLAAVERAAAIPAVLALALLCGLAFSWGGKGWRRLACASAAAFPVAFVADMAWWMRWACSHLDPTAPLKLKPFTIPFLGAGQVAQFRSELQPLVGFYLAAAAVVLVLEASWLSRD